MNIKDAMKKKGLKLIDLANLTHLSPSYLQNIMYGVAKIEKMPLWRVLELCDILGIDNPKDLVEDENETKVSE